VSLERDSDAICLTPGRRVIPRTLLLRTAVVAIAALCLGACERRPPNPLGVEDASLVLIVLDAGNAGHVGAYGYPVNTTPRIDALAKRGVLFERTYSQAATTFPSVPSFLSGLYPQTIARRVSDGSTADKPTVKRIVRGLVDPDNPGRPRYLAEAFADAGFKTAAFSENPLVAGGIGLDIGFEEFQSHFQDDPPPKEAVRRTERLISEAQKWLGTVGDRPFFLYLHLLRPHAPYWPPERILEEFRPPKYAGRLQPDEKVLRRLNRGLEHATPEELAYIVAHYDANYRYADELVGRIEDTLAELGLSNRTMIVVTADHGEAFNEHGQYMHHSTAYDEMIQVPLVFAPPAGATLGTGRISEPVALIDLAPTVAELFGLELPGVDGESLVASLRSPTTAPKRRLLFTEAGDVVAVIDGKQKFILNRSAVPPYQNMAALYDLEKDPDERVNLVAENPETVRRLGGAAQRFLGTTPVDYRIQNAAKAFDPKIQGQLEALGYIDAPEPEASPR